MATPLSPIHWIGLSRSPRKATAMRIVTAGPKLDASPTSHVGAVEMPAKQTGSPMTYQIDGKQYVVVAVSNSDGAELLAYALP